MAATAAPASDSDQIREAARFINNQLDWCLSSHANTRCNTAATPHTTALPKRLIHLDPSTRRARLVTTPSPLPRYAILSYVWGGPGDDYCLTQNNIFQMHAGIPVSHLPLTLQHVFELVNHLSISHLWVDALCIVQDDPHEIATEIVNMASTYVNAFLQIAAMSSLGARHGLLVPGDGALSLEEHHRIMKVCRSLRQEDWDSTLYEHYRLLTRGWTFQERILARRCVHFTKKELVWECKSGRRCGCGEIGGMQVEGQALINNMSAALEACMMLGEGRQRKGRVSPLWRECVMSYSKRNLGKPSDRLPAISGIAVLLQPPGGELEYCAGLWRESMPFDLLWRCDQTSRLGERKKFQPSWSWASVHCGVNWPTAKLWMGGPRTSLGEVNSGEVNSALEKSLAYLTSETYFEYGLEGVPVRRVEVEPVNSRFGEIRRGTMVLSSRKVAVQIRRRREEEGRGSDQTDWVVEGTTGSSLPFYPDVQLTTDGQEVIHNLGDKTYWLVEVASASQGHKIWEAGLVMRQAVGSEDTYQRIGMAGYHVCEPRDDKRWFQPVHEREDIILV